MDKQTIIKYLFYVMLLVYVISLFFIFETLKERECGNYKLAYNYCREEYNTHCAGNPLYSLSNPLNFSAFNLSIGNFNNKTG